MGEGRVRHYARWYYHSTYISANGRQTGRVFAVESQVRRLISALHHWAAVREQHPPTRARHNLRRFRICDDQIVSIPTLRQE